MAQLPAQATQDNAEPPLYVVYNSPVQGVWNLYNELRAVRLSIGRNTRYRFGKAYSWVEARYMLTHGVTWREYLASRGLRALLDMLKQQFPVNGKNNDVIVVIGEPLLDDMIRHLPVDPGNSSSGQPPVDPPSSQGTPSSQRFASSQSLPFSQVPQSPQHPDPPPSPSPTLRSSQSSQSSSQRSGMQVHRSLSRNNSFPSLAGPSRHSGSLTSSPAKPVGLGTLNESDDDLEDEAAVRHFAISCEVNRRFQQATALESAMPSTLELAVLDRLIEQLVDHREFLSNTGGKGKSLAQKRRHIV